MTNGMWQGVAIMAAISVGSQLLPHGQPSPSPVVAVASQLAVRAPSSPSYNFSTECRKAELPADVAQVCAQRASNVIGRLGLFAAVVAGAASIFAGFLLSRQIRQTERHEQERNRKKQLASRASLPILLSDIGAYTVDLKESLRPLFSAVGEDNIVNSAGVDFDVPPMPVHTVPQLKEAIEASTRMDIQERLADIISTLQLCHGRIRSMRGRLVNNQSIILRVNLIGSIVDIASLRALSGSLYQYVRRETEGMSEYNFESLRLALTELYFVDALGLGDDVDGSNYVDALEVIDRWERQGLDPYIFNLGERADREAPIREVK